MKYRVTFEVEVEGAGPESAVAHAREYVRQNYKTNATAIPLEEGWPGMLETAHKIVDPAILAEIEKFKKEGGKL